MLVMLSVTAPVLVRVTILGRLVTPTTVLGNVSEVGDSEATAPLGFTVRLKVVDSLKVPEVPLMVMVAGPSAAVALAVRVNVLVLVVGLGTKAAVTPLGKPEAVKLTLPLKPFSGFTVMVLVTLLP